MRRRVRTYTRTLFHKNIKTLKVKYISPEYSCYTNKAVLFPGLDT